jgi:hypothetical protein
MSCLLRAKYKLETKSSLLNVLTLILRMFVVYVVCDVLFNLRQTELPHVCGVY